MIDVETRFLRRLSELLEALPPDRSAHLVTRGRGQVAPNSLADWHTAAVLTRGGENAHAFEAFGPTGLDLPLTWGAAADLVASDLTSIASMARAGLEAAIAATFPSALRGRVLERPELGELWPLDSPAFGPDPAPPSTRALAFLLAAMDQRFPAYGPRPDVPLTPSGAVVSTWVARALDREGRRDWGRSPPYLGPPGSAAVPLLCRAALDLDPLDAARAARDSVRELLAGDVEAPPPPYRAAVRSELEAIAADAAELRELREAAARCVSEVGAVAGLAARLFELARNTVAPIFALPPDGRVSSEPVVIEGIESTWPGRFVPWPPADPLESAAGPFGAAVLAPSAAFLGFLAGRGEHGQREAAEAERTAADRLQTAHTRARAPWALWLTPDVDALPLPPPPWLGWLARVELLDRWLPELAELARRARMYSGVAGTLPLAVARAVTSGAMDVRRTSERIGDQLVLRAPDRTEVARIDLRLHREITNVIGSAPASADALLTFAIHSGFERWRTQPDDGRGAGEILIFGGKRGLSEQLGCNEADVARAIEWGRSLSFPSIDVSAIWMWNGTYQPEARHRQGAGLLTIQSAFLPMSEKLQTGKGRYFTPWTAPPPLPAYRPNRGPYLRFWRFLCVHIASRSADGASRDGWVTVSPLVLLDLANAAGLVKYPAAITFWRDAGALEVDGPRFRLGSLFASDRQVIEDNARLYLSAQAGGRAQAARADRGRSGAFRKKPT